MTTPLISIALATHNAGSYLKEQMASLQAQTYPNIEIVVSDDASTDGTYEWLCEQALHDSRIRVLPQLVRAGFNRNFARCFQACEGYLISPCDQDDRWSVDKTTKLAAACPPGGIVYCDSRFIDEAGDPFVGRRSRMSSIKRMSDNPPLLALLQGNAISGHAMMFDRDLLDSLSDLPDIAFYDWWIALTASAQGRPLKFLDEPLVDYRRHRGAITSKSSKTTSKVAGLQRALQSSEILAALPGTLRVDVLRQYVGAVQTWFGSWVSPPAFLFFWRHRHSLFWFDAPRVAPGKRAVQFLFGYRLWHLLRPTRYPRVELGETAVPMARE
ncbi:glycosyltransferase [Pseudoxanthomonas sp. UTMC 1351]|uniref:glycosyltransferase n=1 Tax=Pseudoxanthomonas sp. UTMC 1351 TaxID=2695853 RepID=UPI0034CFE39D